MIYVLLKIDDLYFIYKREVKRMDSIVFDDRSIAQDVRSSIDFLDKFIVFKTNSKYISINVDRNSFFLLSMRYIAYCRSMSSYSLLENLLYLFNIMSR